MENGKLVVINKDLRRLWSVNKKREKKISTQPLYSVTWTVTDITSSQRVTHMPLFTGHKSDQNH